MLVWFQMSPSKSLRSSERDYQNVLKAILILPYSLSCSLAVSNTHNLGFDRAWDQCILTVTIKTIIYLFIVKWCAHAFIAHLSILASNSACATLPSWTSKVRCTAWHPGGTQRGGGTCLQIPCHSVVEKEMCKFNSDQNFKP